MRVLRTIGPSRTRTRRRSLLSASPGERGGKGRRLWWTLRGVALGAAALAAAGGALWAWERAAYLPALAVASVEIEGNRTASADELRSLAGVAPGDPLLLVPLDRVRQGVMRHPWLASASVSRRLPGVLAVQVRERAPLALLAQDGGFALVDREARVLATGPAGGPTGDRYPILGGVAGRFAPGETAFPAVPALAALAALEGPGALPAERISEVSLAPDGRILVSLTGSGTVLVMGKDDPGGQAARLARLSAAGAFDLGAAGYDLRFTDRVIRLPDREPEPPKKGKTDGKG